MAIEENNRDARLPQEQDGNNNRPSTSSEEPVRVGVMNQQCKVCGEPAAGYHFGAFTCEGCKSFFGRTYNNASNIAECKNGNSCVINKKNRTTCKSCRLQKCILVGMSKSSSRYGRRSNWFKIHCLLTEQGGQNLALAASAAAPYPPNYLVNMLKHNENNAHNNDRADLPSPNQGDLAYQVQAQLASLQVAILNREQRGRQSPRSDEEGHPEEQAPSGSRSWQENSSHPESAEGAEKAAASSTNIGLSEENASSQSTMRTAMSLALASMRRTPNDMTARMMMTTRTDISEEEYAHLFAGLELFRNRANITGRNDSVSESSSAGDNSMDGERTRDGEFRSSPNRLNCANSPSLSEQGSPRSTVNAALTLRPLYQHGYGQYNMNTMYPPRDLVTPSTAHPMAGCDRLQISPNPGRVADEQNEPIDLSVRPDRSSNKPTKDDQTTKEDQRACTPLDLTVNLKRPKSTLDRVEIVERTTAHGPEWIKVLPSQTSP
ncbi:uncharacterized protein LOC116849138 [Odontomachus brunneus]|uniref:uncharacterized protein LOC116849138 n=1 Tax=Odontomachus brunneus TaxID=486640 RepID=UPI0013F1B228|nr:uncharacterized protein LOC116849138 [Odontomachus brunneus]XP_032681900.1 uncharacterized protein LOC116849138 [Odontomachus brunneus]XP_032681901.1 uncharacterized protein LOC116849138 [Odontomachus brunneus]XP_032681902.1 uncharacterized protein LOC116849138 [Odontomachus brunneus]